MDEGRAFPVPAGAGWAGDYQLQAPARSAGWHGGRAIFATIATADRAGQCQVLARSAREHHPDARLAVLLLDEGARRLFDDVYDLVLMPEALGLPGLADMRFRYSVAELCYALKPWLIRHLFEAAPNEAVYYLDSDIELMGPLAEVAMALAQGANLVLTPHILQPSPDGRREADLLRSGAFNAGFLALAPTMPARAFVAWWCERVRTGCTQDPDRATYDDQKWLDLAPAICDGVAVLRHPGYNVAYWNAPERPLSCVGGMWSAAGAPLRFLHYSQWNLREHDAAAYLARYFRPDDQPPIGLFAEYEAKVRGAQPAAEAAGDAAEGGPRTPTGEPVPEIVRRAYARHCPAVDGDAAAVFARAVGLLNLPSRERAELAGLPMTILYDEIWRRHGDLRFRYEVDRPAGRLAFLRWLDEAGGRELRLPSVFLREARAALDRERVRQLEAADETDPAPADEAALPAVGIDEPRRQAHDIRLLVGRNKALRRELHGLRVRRWRDEETIAALEAALAQRMDAHAAQATAPGAPRQPQREPVLAQDEPFYKRGFQLGDGAAVVDGAVRRARQAASGTLVFGPYIRLPAGRYSAVIDARVYARLPLLSEFTLDVVCDGGQRRLAARKCRLNPLLPRRRFRLDFAVPDGDSEAEFEVRIWARRGTPLEIAGIELYRLGEAA